MEPEAQTLAINLTGDHQVRAGEIAAVSVAISIKRIADEIAGIPSTGERGTPEFSGGRLGIADAIGNAIYNAIANVGATR